MERFLKAVTMFCFPSGLVLLLAVGFLRPRGLPEWLHQPVAAIPYIVLVFGLVSGWYLSSNRLILSFLVLASAERASSAFPVADADSVGPTIFAVTAFLLPLNLLAFSIVREHSPSRIRDVIRLLIVCTQPFLVLWICSPDQKELAASFARNYIEWLPTRWTPVPQPALAAFLLAGGMYVARFVVRRDAVDAGSFWVLTAVFLAYHGTRIGWHPTNFFSAAGFILWISVLQSMHQQVYRDDVTGLAGRQAYEQAIQRLGSRYAYAVLALDQLKSYQNVHGKPVGEQVFKMIAPLVQETCGEATVYRLSGEELIALFPGRSAVETLPALEAVRKAVEATSLVLRGRDRVRATRTPRIEQHERELPVSISAGVAEGADESISFGSVQKAAYRALYEARSAGGNAVKRGRARTEEPARRAYDGRGGMAPSGQH